jgi:uncharacterized protein (TIGR00255 family)
MSVESMTGFARHTANAGRVAIVWELKSVNGKALDLRFRFPSGWERLEPAVRQQFQSAFSRGNIQANLALDAGDAGDELVINEAVLKQFELLSADLSARLGLAPPTVADVLSLPGILQRSETAADEALEPAILQCLGEAVLALKQARLAEGAALQAILLGHADAVEALTLKAEADPARQPEAIRARIADNIATLLGAAPALDQDRLASEALFIASRADIREEIDRLKTHVKSARQLLAQGGAAGRKLDFLAQEFNREANTLCSKSNAASITAVGLVLKAAVDQFREQVQNLE